MSRNHAICDEKLKEKDADAEFRINKFKITQSMNSKSIAVFRVQIRVRHN